MTIEEAFEEIGIPPGNGPDEIRRAYLRKLKTRKPEVDPEGFRRLREAFELLSENAQVISRVAAARPLEPVPTVREPESPSAIAVPDSFDFPGLSRRLASCENPEERLELLREAVREHPREERLRWWLVTELEEVGLHAELLALLRHFDAEGFPDFFEHLARQFPHTLHPGDIARLQEKGDPESLALAAEAWLLRGRPEPAVESLLRAMEVAETTGDAHAPDPERLLLFLVRLQARGSLNEAARLQTRFADRLRKAGRELDLLSPDSAAVWQIAQELALLSPSFPARMRAAIGKAVVDGSPEMAIPVLQWLVETEPESALWAAAEIAKLPVLEELYGHLFEELPLPVSKPRSSEPRGYEEPQTGSFMRALLVGCVVPSAFMVLLLLVLSYTAEPPPPSPAAIARSTPAPPLSLPPPLRFDSAEEALQAVCGGEGPVLVEAIEICGRARETMDHLRQRDCPRMFQAHMRLRSAVAKVPSPFMDALIEAIRTEGAPLCDRL